MVNINGLTASEIAQLEALLRKANDIQWNKIVKPEVFNMDLDRKLKGGKHKT